MRSVRPLLLSLAALTASAACRSAPPPRPAGVIGYRGSSTVAVFLRAAERVYGAVDFEIDTESESEGGEAAILEGRADLAGIAREPRASTLEAGVRATLVGRDAIAVVVNGRNPRTELSQEELERIFTGQVENWRELGGPDLPLTAYIAGEESATHEVFRSAVLGPRDYAGCRVVRPGGSVVRAVAGDPGGIGHVGFSSLDAAEGVRAIAVDGQAPAVTNSDYPIARPLHLLWVEGSPVVEAFVRWTQSAEGQRTVMRDFLGARVAGSVSSPPEEEPTGTLVVYTETRPTYDGGIYYYPHGPYEILDREGGLLRKVRNSRGHNDERAMRIAIAPGTYLIRTETSKEGRIEFFVTVEEGKLTELDVPFLLESLP